MTSPQKFTLTGTFFNPTAMKSDFCHYICRALGYGVLGNHRNRGVCRFVSLPYIGTRTMTPTLNQNKVMENTNNEKRAAISVPFMLTAILFNVCLIASNLFETKLFTIGPVNLTGGVIIFPISYIINDCLTEVWGYRRARFVIWTGFAMNFFVMAMAQIVVHLPAPTYWDGGEHFDFVFRMAPRVVLASMLAFFFGSTVNAWIMSRMKVRDKGRRFSVRAIVSTIGGETLDSLIFFPIAFFGVGFRMMLVLMVTQIFIKTLYEIIILPLTNLVVKKLKKYEGIDTYDYNISYNPFKIFDV